MLEYNRRIIPSGFSWEIFALSNYHTQDPSGGISNNNSSFSSRREIRANNATGSLPVIGTFSVERSHSGNFDFDQMIQSLHDLFEHDRQVASQSDSTRCGICYMHFPIAELHYRDEGFYTCAGCARSLGNHRLTMLRKQQRFS
jgi:hypothetical protein